MPPPCVPSCACVPPRLRVSVFVWLRTCRARNGEGREMKVGREEGMNGGREGRRSQMGDGLGCRWRDVELTFLIQQVRNDFS